MAQVKPKSNKQGGKPVPTGKKVNTHTHTKIIWCYLQKLNASLN